ncbi:hypothetical protein D3C75_703440 [compost metagenome]
MLSHRSEVLKGQVLDRTFATAPGAHQGNHQTFLVLPAGNGRCQVFRERRTPQQILVIGLNRLVVGEAQIFHPIVL